MSCLSVGVFSPGSYICNILLEHINLSLNRTKICSIHSYLLGVPYDVMVSYIMISIGLSKILVALWDNKEMILALTLPLLTLTFILHKQKYIGKLVTKFESDWLPHIYMYIYTYIYTCIHMYILVVSITLNMYQSSGNSVSCTLFNFLKPVNDSKNYRRVNCQMHNSFIFFSKMLCWTYQFSLVDWLFCTVHKKLLQWEISRNIAI